MNRNELTILVTGATGHQGGGAARHLLADGWKVRAFVRDASKPEAVALARAGAELFVGNLNLPASVEAAVAGTYGVYSVQSLAEGAEAELRQSKNLGEAAKAAGVKHVVYSSVIGADRPSVLPWVVNKVAMEAYLRELGLPLTVLRPVTFMENILGQRDSILAGTYSSFEPADVVHQWIAADDIGRFVALAFADPGAWIGTATEIAGDELTGPQAAEALAAAVGRPVVFQQAAPPAGMPAPAAPPVDAPPPNRAHIAKLRETIPDLVTFAEWAARQHANGVL